MPIEINVLPGKKKGKAKSRGASSGSSSGGFSFGGFGGGGGGGLGGIGSSISSFLSSLTDPYLIVAVVASAIAGVVIAGLYVRQTALEHSLTTQEQQAVQDSVTNAAVLARKREAEAQRDSVLAQLTIIKQIDNDRFVWPHIMDEISRSMPPYTWLTSLTYLTPAPSAGAPSGAQPGQPGQPAPPAAGGAAPPKKPGVDTLPPPPLQFRLVGNTVDIQALTRLMRLLESSPFIQNVQLAKSVLVVEEAKEVTQFTLEAEYQRPDSSAIRRVPFTLSVR